MIRFLIDLCISPRVAAGLREKGYDAIHVCEIGLSEAGDEALLRLAGSEGRVVLTADSDFGELLAVQKLRRPSVILFRDDAPASAAGILAILELNLGQFEDAMLKGALVVVRAASIRVRMLPIIS